MLLHYRVTAEIGAGSVGDVYRVVQIRLGCAEARKVVPDAPATILALGWSENACLHPPQRGES